MIQRDTAATLLQPLARPTQHAFDSAVQLAKASRDATADARASCSPSVLTMLVGVEFWAIFASNLAVAYRQIEGVAEDDSVHKLQHVWFVGAEIRLQLKSDTASVAVEQLMIPGIEAQVARARADVVALTWGHRGEERFSPAFVHMIKSGGELRQAWRLPLAALLAETADAAVGATARSTLTSRIKPAESGEGQISAEKT